MLEKIVGEVVEENKVHVIGVEQECAAEWDGVILGTAAMDQ